MKSTQYCTSFSKEVNVIHTYIKNIFLYQGMKNDCDKKVEKHGRHIFRAILVKVYWFSLFTYKKKNAIAKKRNCQPVFKTED